VKSGHLNLLEPLGPVQACNGVALPLPLPIFMICSTEAGAKTSVTVTSDFVQLQDFFWIFCH
jgi:hypothetical protein